MRSDTGGEPAAAVLEANPDARHLVYTGGTTGMSTGVIWRVADLIGGPLGVRGVQTVQDAVNRPVAARGRLLSGRL